MKQYILILKIVFLVICSTKSVQAQTYYKTNNSDRIFTQDNYEDYKKNIASQLKEKHGEVTINERLIDSIISHDSIIKTYKLDIRIKRNPNGSRRPEEKIYSYLNKELPNFNLQTIDGKNMSLSDLKNKPTIINFWFTRCKPCIEEIPVLNKLVKKYSDQVNFIGITPDNKETVTQFLKTHTFNYVHLVNARKYINDIGILGYPKNIFIDKLGEIKYIERGIPYFKQNGVMKLGTGDEFERLIKKLL
ncbi:TlpA disulfide reductase family protein [Algibacter sp. 2305UL17-15]|uniref:TlpA family protein disulfide reductase n=1 Tax=Algibacter sp. 2305UL17-15 TaxID=3231268 RepID=UPI003457A680